MRVADLDLVTSTSQLAKFIGVQTGLFAGAADLIADVIDRDRQKDKRLSECEKRLSELEAQLGRLEAALAESPIGLALPERR